MPKVSQAHLDARRQQILDAARARFAGHGFAHTSMADIVAESGLSIGAIYRYFTSKEEIVVGVCEQAGGALPQSLTAETVSGFLEHVRAMAREKGHARLVAQIYAEAALSPSLATVVRQQLAAQRAAVAALVPDHRRGDAEQIAEAFVALCSSYSQQLAIRGDVDPAPFTAALMAIVEGQPAPPESRRTVDRRRPGSPDSP
ncbi:TetR/AcrR family transcriptional regulator [Actinacidiphila guanduensis]|uniref:Transcriptional regulator, TetR family n=1 Tax=Actinacidiphila guanduensis TaxID=310781 RepID=A0A1G9Z7Q8_9ACTN|nr:TetR/AcrR family transcriptional regulator [Actinacidiphila guanduensis]SDN17145.1 transcriptional regulator, TetR family [Actinacidiphila guanduensis]